MTDLPEPFGEPTQLAPSAAGWFSSAARKPGVAALASLVLPGLGQFYNGDLNRAIWLFLVFSMVAIPGLALVALYLPEGWMVPALALGLLVTLSIWVYAVWQAWSTARQLQDYVVQPWQLSGVYALILVLCDLLALPMLSLYVREHQVEPFRIPSRSMEPSVLQGDFIFADKRYNCPGCRQGVHRGDIVIFAYPNDRSLHYIKRVIALPGDQVQISGQQVQVNGQPLQVAGGAADQVTEQIEGHRWQIRPAEKTRVAPSAASPVPLNRVAAHADAEWNLRVPDGQVFVLGDARSASVDSRTFGTVPLQDILGRARQVWFSSDQGQIRWERLGRVLQ